MLSTMLEMVGYASAPDLDNQAVAAIVLAYVHQVLFTVHGQ